MTAIELLLESFDDALGHPFEALMPVLQGLTPAEAAWQAPGFAGEAHDTGVGQPGTILWILRHLVHCHRHYTQVLKAAGAGPEPETPPPGELELAATLAAFEEANRELRAEIARIDPARLAMKATPNQKTGEFVLSLCRHIAWHAAQARMIRRQYRARE